MKVVFKDRVPDRLDKPFANYEYDESLAKHPYYIDLKHIVREKLWEWLDEIQISYDNVARRFLRHTRWWWVTFMSRWDVRPYAQDYLFKPVLFAMALIEWKKANTYVPEVLVIGGDPLVGAYLREFDKTLILECRGQVVRSDNLILLALKHVLLSFMDMLRCVYYLIRHHLFRRKISFDFPVVVLYESVYGNFSSAGYKYFYGSMFDNFNGLDEQQIGFVCTSNQLNSREEIRKRLLENREGFFLLDNIGVSDLIKGLAVSMHIILATCLTALSNIPCCMGEIRSWIFWKRFLIQELNRGDHLSIVCCYHALKKFLRKSRCRLVIYPYEEKGIERAILFATKELSVDSVGYTPHPQYRLALALRDKGAVLPPRPTRYTVCGPNYVDYFVKWGGKDRGKISIWGTDKHLEPKLLTRHMDRRDLKILVLLSHPGELKIMHSWLRSEKKLTEGITYLVRAYKAVDTQIFDRILTPLTENFECVKETKGSFTEDLGRCDFAVFCGTSAGLLAVNYGYIAVFLDLRGFFKINPCFDELDVMLQCSNSKAFADRIDEICSMDEEMIKALHMRQLEFVKKIFYPVQHETIRSELLYYIN